MPPWKQSHLVIVMPNTRIRGGIEIYLILTANYCLEVVPTSKVPTNILGDRDFLHTDLQLSPLLPWYHFSMTAKTFVLIFKIIRGLTPSCLKFASMNPADSYALWRLLWPQSWEQGWGHSTLCSGHLAKEQQSRGKQL